MTPIYIRNVSLTQVRNHPLPKPKPYVSVATYAPEPSSIANEIGTTLGGMILLMWIVDLLSHLCK